MNIIDVNTIVSTLSSLSPEAEQIAKKFNDKSKSLKQQVFCNIELNGEAIEAVGFDMDFTLAQYKEDFDLLAFEGAKQKLVHNLGYPADPVLSFHYDSSAFRRAFHGMKTELSSAERRNIYSKEIATFTESNYVIIDTLFTPIDSMLFSQLVDLKDSKPNLIKQSYEQMYKDIRACVDLCHRDGVIKDTVLKDPASYIIYDENIVPMLKRIRKSGKKVFLLTNSMWEYTEKVMEFLVYGNGDNKDVSAWQDLFDVVIVGGCKPAFLTDTYLALFTVSPQGYLKNVEDRESCNLQYLENKSKIFQGGCWQDLHRMLEITSGDRILYVGDHIYADILRSKRTLGWRTCLIIPELEHELETAQKESKLYGEVLTLRRLQYELDEHIDTLRRLVEDGDKSSIDLLSDALQQSVDLKIKVRNLNESFNEKFNKTWGQLFKAGYQDTRFAKQVMDYACLYTSRASNLGLVFPNRSFRPVQDFMPHDQVLFDNARPL
eukprot:gene18611-24340_t